MEVEPHLLLEPAPGKKVCWVSWKAEVSICMPCAGAFDWAQPGECRSWYAYGKGGERKHSEQASLGVGLCHRQPSAHDWTCQLLQRVSLIPSMDTQGQNRTHFSTDVSHANRYSLTDHHL